MAVKKTRTVKKAPGRPKSAPEETRAKLLEAATDLFAANGMGATSLAKVAAEAGVTSAMVHYYFKTKEQLIQAVVVERLGRFLNTVLGAGDFDPDDPLEYVFSVVPRLAAAVEAHPWMPGLWVREVISADGGLREYIFTLLPTEMFGRLAACYAKGQESGKYSADIDPRLLLFTVITTYMLPLAAKGLLEKLPIMGELTSERLIRHAQAVLRYGLSGRAHSDGPAAGQERSRS